MPRIRARILVATVTALAAVASPPNAHATEPAAFACHQGSLRNVAAGTHTTFTCPIPTALRSSSFILSAKLRAFNGGTAPHTARTSCTLIYGNGLDAGGQDHAGSGLIVLGLAVHGNGAASFDVRCNVHNATAQLTNGLFTGIAVSSLTTTQL